MLDSDFNAIKKSYAIDFAGEQLILDAMGAIFLPQHRLLVVADLHLEKGSYFASRGNPLPHYDTMDTLQRLEQLMLHYQPQKIICLGDNLHDMLAIERMLPKDYMYLCELNQRAEWLWIIGNHDTEAIHHPLLKNFKFLEQLQLNAVLFSHEINANAAWQIVGHFHPKATIHIRSHKMTGKCFLIDPTIVIMPAFGSYTGGLDITSAVFTKMINKAQASCFFLKNNKIWAIPVRMKQPGSEKKV